MDFGFNGGFMMSSFNNAVRGRAESLAYSNKQNRSWQEHIIADRNWPSLQERIENGDCEE